MRTYFKNVSIADFAAISNVAWETRAPVTGMTESIGTRKICCWVVCCCCCCCCFLQVFIALNNTESDRDNTLVWVNIHVVTMPFIKVSKDGGGSFVITKSTSSFF